MYYQETVYAYPHCCLTSPRVNRFLLETVAEKRILEFRPRFGNRFPNLRDFHF